MNYEATTADFEPNGPDYEDDVISHLSSFKNCS